MPPATQQWAKGLDKNLRFRLRNLELLAPDNGDGVTIGNWMREYIEKRNDVKERTHINYEQARKSMMAFLGNDIPIREFTAGHADDFRLHLLGKGLAEATVRRRCKRVKQFFAAAIKHGFIEKNPFAEVPTGNVANESRRTFVDRDTIDTVIAGCPTDEWRLIFALARYGGLRIPSEIQGLRWSDIDWSKKTFRVHSPKTEHLDRKQYRDVPMFPELVPYFEEWKNQRGDGEELVFPRLLGRSNIREYALRIIRKASIEPWPRVYQNLRASRETELVEEFPVHVVTSWLGNTPDVAAKHYLSVLPAHLERAVSPKGSNGNGQNGTDMGQTITDTGCHALTAQKSESSEMPDLTWFGNTCHLESVGDKNQLVPRRGLEPPTYRLGICRSVQMSYRGPMDRQTLRILVAKVKNPW